MFSNSLYYATIFNNYLQTKSYCFLADYSFVMNGGRKVTFYLNELQRNEAENVCEQDSSNLLIVENSDMQNFINEKMKNIPLKVSSTDSKYLNGWWTAGINNPNNGTWFWSTGNNSLKVFNGSSFNNWKGYSPLRYSSKNCMYLYPFNNLTYNFKSEDSTKTFYNSFGGWLNKPCNFKSYYICIKSKFFKFYKYFIILFSLFIERQRKKAPKKFSLRT